MKKLDFKRFIVSILLVLTQTLIFSQNISYKELNKITQKGCDTIKLDSIIGISWKLDCVYYKRFLFFRRTDVINYHYTILLSDSLSSNNQDSLMVTMVSDSFNSDTDYTNYTYNNRGFSVLHGENEQEFWKILYYSESYFIVQAYIYNRRKKLKKTSVKYLFIRQ